MANLEDDSLPTAYYKPLDSRMRVRVRKTRVLRLFLVLCVMGSIMVFGYFRYYQPEAWLLNFDNGTRMVMDWWKGTGHVPLSTTTPGQKEKDPVVDIPQEKPTPEPKPKPIPAPNIRDEPVPSKPKVEDRPPPVDRSPDIYEQPTKYVVPTHHETSAPIPPQDSGYFQLLTNIMTPDLFIPMMRSFLLESGDSVIEMLDPILTTIIPQQNLDQLGTVFKSISKGDVHLAEAIERVVAPIGKSAAKMLISVFPELGNEVIDSCNAGFEHLNRFLQTSDSQSLVGAFSHTASDYIVPILGLEKSARRQVDHALEDTLNTLIPDLSKANFHDFSGIAFPSSSEVQTAMVNLVTKIASLKAQAKIASTIASTVASQASQYLTGGKDDATTNMVTNMATQLIQNFMSGSKNSDQDDAKPSDSKKPQESASFLNYFFGGADSSAPSESSPQPKPTAKKHSTGKRPAIEKPAAEPLKRHGTQAQEVPPKKDRAAPNVENSESQMSSSDSFVQRLMGKDKYSQQEGNEPDVGSSYQQKKAHEARVKQKPTPLDDDDSGDI
jgi:hypothetical protein